MGVLDTFKRKPFPPAQKREIDRLIENLIRIGQQEDFLSERPGGAFNAQCRHTGAREIGKRLAAWGGSELMEYALKKVRKSLGATLAAHLSYAWTDIQNWVP